MDDRKKPVCFFALLYLMCVSTNAEDNLTNVDFVQRFNPDGAVVCVQGVVNGTKAKMVLDTGTPFHIYGLELKTVLRGIMELEDGVEETPTASYTCDPQDIWLGSFCNNDLRSLVTNLSALRIAINEKIDGVVGMPLLSQNVIQLDFEKGIVRIGKECSLSRKSIVSLHFDENDLPHVVDLKADDIRFACLLDTGMSNAVSLSQKYFDAFQQLELISSVGSTRMIKIGQTRNVKTGVLGEIRIGGHRLTNVPVHLSDTNKIGVGLLRKFHVCIDMPNRELILLPNRNFAHPFTP